MSITNAQLAQQISELLTYWRTRDVQFRDWLSGPADGGPNLDGTYPLTDYLNQVYYVKSPARLQADVDGLVNSASAYAAAADASAGAAAGARAAAESARDLALSYRDSALSHKNAAEAAQSAAENAMVNAIAHSGLAETAASNAETSATNAAISETNAAQSASDAADSAAAAAASAAAAATFNPDLFSPVGHDHDDRYALLGHTHSASDITSGTLSDERIAQSSVTQHQAALSIAWSQLTSVPTTFPPSSHTHGWGDITGLPAYATRWPSWSEVTSKPSTFPPSSHTHSASDISDGTLTLTDPGTPMNLIRLTASGTRRALTWRATSGQTGVPATNVVCVPNDGTADLWGHQFEFDFDTKKWLFRSGLHDASITQSSVKQHEAALSIGWAQLTGVPAYATRWPSWSEVTGKPSTFTPSSHTHDWGDITGLPAYATRWPSWSEVTGKPSTFTPSAHTHSWSDITGLPAYATRWPSWSEVTSKPSTFPPSSHTHSAADLSGVAKLNEHNEFTGRVVSKDAFELRDDALDARLHMNITTGGRIYFAPWYNGAYNFQREFGFDPAVEKWYADGGFTDASITQSSVKQHEAALSIGWAQLTGKPSTFPPSSHTHTVSQITDLADNYARLGAPNEFVENAAFGKNGSRGYVFLSYGTSSAAGYIGIHRADDSRIGYIGWNTDSFAITAEGGLGISLIAPGGVFYYDKPFLRHSASYGSGVVHVSFSPPSGGADGDIWLQLV